MASKCFQFLKESRMVPRGWFGAKLVNIYKASLDELEYLNKECPTTKGVLVTELAKEATDDVHSEARLEIGDVIVKCNGKDVDSLMEFTGMLLGKADQTLDLVVKRAMDGKEKQVKRKLLDYAKVEFNEELDDQNSINDEDDQNSSGDHKMNDEQYHLHKYYRGGRRRKLSSREVFISRFRRFDISNELANDFFDNGARVAILKASPSVVSVVSIDQDGNLVKACSGTIVKHAVSQGTYTILTSASLIEPVSRKKSYKADKHKISVILMYGKEVEGKLLGFDFHYKLAAITIKSDEIERVQIHPVSIRHL
ncbi:hypothetical protein CCACVL1_19839 [Corchorus capsularis]|uniref:PDZ domain-containing protein n=1 Tax=Corchorus capsularis TaxID=210143 RepID=A0A1R3HEP1_COCAP|nr:hypothetical protein CCACVL1_19839 [Corchorus capsularis]